MHCLLASGWYLKGFFSLVLRRWRLLRCCGHYRKLIKTIARLRNRAGEADHSAINDKETCPDSTLTVEDHKNQPCGHYDFLFWSSCSSSSSRVRGTVLWLYRPWAISCRARGFFWPEAFLILARLFWNQIFIWASFRPSSPLSCCRRLSVRYRFSANSCFSLASWAPEKAVRGRFSSGVGAPFGQGFFTRLDLGP